MIDMIWYERHRPRELSQLALTDENRTLLDSWLAAGEIPHTILSGPPGTGKTTIARLLTRKLDCTVLALNASNERGIDVIREKVGAFARTLLDKKWNVVWFDEADGLTRDAQEMLRNMLEAFVHRTRFIFTCNHLHRIIAPLQSRCRLIELSSPPFKERARILRAVLDAEGVEYTPKLVLAYAKDFLDMRRMLDAAQHSVMAHGGLVPVQALSTDGEAVLRHIQAADWGALRAVTGDPAFECTSVLRSLFYAIPDDHADAANWRYIVAKAVHESGWSPDPVILFLGTTAELMKESK